MEQTYPRPTRRQLRALHPSRPLRWYDYADVWLSRPLGRVLDYGCGHGRFLARIEDRAVQCWGVDIDPEAVAAAARLVPGAHLERLDIGAALPFPDGSFDTVVILEVIEHSADERHVLRDLARVLRPGGLLLLTTPHKGLLTFLDPGNFKFLLPRVHRYIHCTLLGRREYYETRFGARRRRLRGMIADFTVDQSPWHRHYRYEHIRSRTPAALETVAWTVYFPGLRALSCLHLALKVLTLGRLETLPGPLRGLSKRLSRCESKLGDQLVILFEKKSHG